MAGYGAHAMQTYGRSPFGSPFGAIASITERISKLVASGKIREVGTSATLPPGIPEVTIDQLEQLAGQPWYKKWWVWAIAGTAVVGGGFLFLRRRRRK